MKITGKRIIQKLTAILLVFVITIANFAIVGKTAISYAIDAVKTNNNNVEFVAYFENGQGEKVTSIDSQIGAEDLKLKVDVTVNNSGLGGYFDGEISLSDANFKFKDEKPLNVYVNAGSTTTVEKEIEFIEIDNLEKEYLNKNTTVNLTGKYKNSKKEYEIEAETTAQVNWISSEDVEAMLETEVLTNYIYKKEEQSKKIVQLLVKSKIKNNSYPVKETNIELNVPVGVEEVKVHKRTTGATNGNKEFNQDNYTYNPETGILAINVTNNEENGKITWLKDAQDIFVITCKYAENAEIAGTEITANSIITTLDDKELKSTSEVVLQNEVNGAVTSTIAEKEEQIYKGKLYTGEEKEYETTNTINIDNAEVLEELTIKENKAIYLAGENIKEANIQYAETKINKQEFTEIFGEDGYLSIQDENGNIIANITNSSETDENGNIIINYNEEVKEITIKTSKPQTEGMLEIAHKKKILKNDYTKEEIKELTQIRESVEIQNGLIENKEIILKETESQAKLELETKNLSTTEEKQVLKISATLKSDDETKDLYKNPIIKIILPSQIEEISAKCKLLYGNGLEIKSASAKKENGRQVIIIELSGEQKSYTGEAVEGAKLVIYADVKLNKLSTNSDEEVILNYTNENATTYADNGQETAKIGITTESPIILTNDINALGVKTIGNEGTKEVTLDVEKESKKATVKMQVINNEGTEISEVKILGKVPTAGNDIERATGVKSSKNAIIYYTTVENPTADINEASNEWTTKNSKDAKNYLVVIEKLEKDEKLDLNYDLNIAENLNYNISASANYSVSYTNTLTSKTSEEKSTTLKLTTGAFAELDSNVTAVVAGKELEDGATVNTGEIIKYNVKVKNNGQEEAKNVNIKATVPDGTTLLKLNPEIKDPSEYQEEEEKPNGMDYYIEVEDKEVKYENITIKPGETVNYEYIVRVKSEKEDKSKIEEKVTVSYNGKDDLLEITNIVNTTPVKVTLVAIETTDGATVQARGTYVYNLYVENVTDKEQEAEISIEGNELNKIIGVEYAYGRDGEDGYTKTVPAQSKINVNIPSKEILTVKVTTSMEQPTNATDSSSISAQVKTSDGTTVHSNAIQNTVEGVAIDLNLTSKVSSGTTTGYVKPGDKIQYKVTLKNTRKQDADKLTISDLLSNYLELEEVQINGKKTTEYKKYAIGDQEKNCSLLEISTPVKAGETVTVTITGKVRETIYTEEIIKIINQVKLYNDKSYVSETEDNIYYLEPTATKKQDAEEPSNPTTPTDPANPDKPSGSENNETEKYIISGIAWLDENQNASRDASEKVLEGIIVYAINISTNKIVTQSKTNSDGFYSLTNLPKGKYIVGFGYDTDKYIVTAYQADGVAESKNSDAIQTTTKINGEEKTLAVTDSIKLNSSCANIDLGLVEAKVFDLELEKRISKIVVTNNSGTNTYEYDDVDLAKAEIHSKYLDGSNVVIEYTIKVKNTGELPGYVKSIVDYIPSSLGFSSNLNSDWYKSGENLYNDSLANTKLEAGETKELKLVLTKTMTESNTGLIKNRAEIAKVANSLGINDKDSTPGDQVNGQDDMSSADVMITVKTGAAISYVALTLTIIILICGVAYLINKIIIKRKISL